MLVDAGQLGGASLSLSRSLALSLSPLRVSLSPSPSTPLRSLLALFREQACLCVVSVKSVHNKRPTIIHSI
jgi:hypothetical protein